MDETLLRALRSLVREHGFDIIEVYLNRLKQQAAEESNARQYKHRNTFRRRDGARAKTTS